MGKGRPRAVEKGVLTHGYPTTTSAAAAASALPPAPVFHPTEEEFSDPLAFIAKIRPQAEAFGICRIVPPPSWKPPFALNRHALSFPTKSQAIHRLQARPPSCDRKTFDLEYSRFLESHIGRKPKRRVVFEGEDLDLCRLFYAVKRYGGYQKVCREKRWGEVFRFLRSAGKISDCSKHVLSLFYLEHLLDYEEYRTQQDFQNKNCKMCISSEDRAPKVSNNKRRKRCGGERVKEVADEELDQICQQCKSGLHGEVMLLCDRCDQGWHLHCLSPPLETVPPGNWYCIECVNSDKDSFGFAPGKWCSLEAFRRKDDRLRRKWFGQGRASRLHIEKRFWDIVEGRAGEVNVMYGSDLDTLVYGSGFPRADDPIPTSVGHEVWKEYCSSPWNLNNFPKLQGSMLRAVRENIPGVMVPWLYLGMLFSSFCWHVEDHCFYSINYLHWGEPKCWYGVPGSGANIFEQVMRNNLPDLFDAQPDLLFHLITMLSPSVLQENDVPVYTVLQEPGNFVITFPRSFHGGFNFGLNCAEAVNFAPADWLPHGGLGAELYRAYHKAGVLSHEELLYVVAKNGCDVKASPYIKKEMHRIIAMEKRYREDIWKNGIVRSSPMSPKKNPEYVGDEEDPICIICKQYLYLSAITCSCRPSIHVCLEHWKHLCECNPNEHRLLYRHSLAELSDLVHMGCISSGSTWNEEETSARKQLPLNSYESSNLSKKGKGDRTTYAQLAEDWLANSRFICEHPFSDISYSNALREAEQFLWADHDMDMIRNMVNKLVEAQKWAVNIRNCLSKIENCLRCHDNNIEKVHIHNIMELLRTDPPPCYEPGLFKLQAFLEDAKLLVAEIESALSSHLRIDNLELLQSRALKFPIHLEETEILAREVSSAKIWMKNARECLSQNMIGAVKIQLLHMLKAEMLELHVQIPEMEEVLDLCREVDSWQIRCKKFLEGPLIMKELEGFLRDSEQATCNIPELETLKQLYHDSYSWSSNLQNVLQNLSIREDYENVVGELSCIFEAGKLLKIRVDELSLVEAELEKSCCREKTCKALSIKMPLDLIQHLLKEASRLGIDEEKMFTKISLVLSAAVSWEEKAQFVLGQGAQMSEFEGLIRSSKEIFAILPSLPQLKNAVSQAQSWISRTQPYLMSNIHDGGALSPLLKVDDLKELVTQSKFLKVNLDTQERLQNILTHVYEWKHNSCSVLESSKSLLCVDNIDLKTNYQLSVTIKELLKRIGSAIDTGSSLGFEFEEMQQLQHTSLTLEWVSKALLFCSIIPSMKEVDSLLEDVHNLTSTFSSRNLVKLLIEGSCWLRKACNILPGPLNSKRFQLTDAEEILKDTTYIVVSYPAMVARIQNAIEKHGYWIEQVHAFFRLSGRKPWASYLEHLECGRLNAFSCPELDKITFEVEKVNKWRHQCSVLVEPLFGHHGSLSTELAKIRCTLEEALNIYHNSGSYKIRAFCVCCHLECEKEDIFTCLTCEDRYHLLCMGPPLATASMKEYVCPFCSFIENGLISTKEGHQLVDRGNRPELSSFIDLLSISEDFCADFDRIEEIPLVQDIVKLALDSKSFFNEIMNQAFSHYGNDSACISRRILCAFKASSVAAVYDHHNACNLKLALCRCSWKIRVNEHLSRSKKSSIQGIQYLLKEGLAINIPVEDHFMREITKVLEKSLQWADIAKKVASDSGALELGEVFNLINEGEALPIHFEKEMELLKARSVLYCICRKPYDQRAMIACDQCDEWFHFDCIGLHEPPANNFFCPACMPFHGDLISLIPPKCHKERLSDSKEPCMLPARLHISKKRRPKRLNRSLLRNKQAGVHFTNILMCYREINDLWRINRRPRQRTRRRDKLENITKFIHFQYL